MEDSSLRHRDGIQTAEQFHMPDGVTAVHTPVSISASAFLRLVTNRGNFPGLFPIQ
jgi:hypothetical protein